MTESPSPFTMLFSRHTRRREFITLLGGAATWPVAARAQQPAMPVIGFVNLASINTSLRNVNAFRAGIGENGLAEGQNVSVEYHWLEGQYDRLPAVMADLVRRHVSVIATPGSNAVSLAAKTATTTIPIVFGVGDDPVRLGLVASLARPGGNATGMNFFAREAVPKRLGLLHELLPKTDRVAVLVNPSTNPESALRQVQDAARAIGLTIDILKASSVREIEEAFFFLVRERIEALFIDGDQFFADRRVQFVTLAARHSIATSYSSRTFPAAGGLMSYGTDVADVYRQVGDYVGRTLKGAKPADLPVLQSTKFEFVINVTTAKALGIDLPPSLLAQADEVIE